ncbi:MAG: hypothetical protein FJ265_14285, partial [Planctomycetes bacterium]|nr:hypothetical protein [Planctomycetota bacterium]
MATALLCCSLPLLLHLPQDPPRPPGAEGQLAHTGSYVVDKGQPTKWRRPPFRYDPAVAAGRKHAKVVVVIYDPMLPETGKRLRAHVGGNDPVHYSHILADVIRQASWGYIDCEIVDWITVDGFPEKVDGG